VSAAREALMAELEDLVGRHGLVKVVDALGDLCVEHATRIGVALRAQRDAKGGLGTMLRGVLHGCVAANTKQRS